MMGPDQEKATLDQKRLEYIISMQIICKITRGEERVVPPLHATLGQVTVTSVIKVRNPRSVLLNRKAVSQKHFRG